MQTTLLLAFVFSGFLQQAPEASQVAAENAAFSKIGAEKNLEARKKLVLTFEKNYPKSDYLPQVFMDLSRMLANSTDFANAKQYAEKAVSTVARMKTESSNSSRKQWLNSLDTSTKSNLAWVQQMTAWRDQQLRSSVLGKR
jgi:hypothetical protein